MGKRILAVMALGGLASCLFTFTPSLANTLPTSGGLYIATGSSNGIFYSFDYIAQNPQIAQNAINTAGLNSVYLDLGGDITNFGQFITSQMSVGISNNTFTSYARSHPYTVPSGIEVMTQTQGQYQYAPSTGTAPVPPPPPSAP